MTQRLNLSMLIGTGLLAGSLAGCAALNTVTPDVATFGDWPAGRAGGSYAFDRMPSQQSQAKSAEALETAAQAALAKAGFKPAADGQQPDVLVQLGARMARTDYAPWADGLWWRGGFGTWRGGPWLGPYGPGWAWRTHAYDNRRYEREVAMLIRDRASGKPLVEARASLESISRGDAGTTAALFDAALQDFPKVDGKPHPVTVTLPSP